MKNYHQLEDKAMLDMLFSLKDALANDDISTVQEKLKSKISELEYTLAQLEKDDEPDSDISIDLSAFDDILAEDETIILIKPSGDHREQFLAAKREYSKMWDFYSNPKFCNSLWEEQISDNSLNYSIMRKSDNQYIGYCGVKNVGKTIWEIAIELLSEYCHKGYGYKALDMYLHKVAELTGRNEFSSRVESDNIPSQGLMEKLGFKPYGITEFLFYSKEEQERIENENLDQIDDRLIELAKKFNTEPKTLLSHVLEYRISIT